MFQHEWVFPTIGTFRPWCKKCPEIGEYHKDPTCPTLLIIIPFLPPTSNQIYVNARGGHGRFLSSHAKAWKARFAQEVVPKVLPDLMKFDRDRPFEIFIRMYFKKEDVLTTTFGQKSGAASRYKRMDLENRLKLMSDSLAKALDIDDSLTFRAGQEKRCCEELRSEPQAHIFVTQRLLTDFGF